MKKRLAFILALALFVMSLAGCGGGKDSGGEQAETG